MKCLLCNRPLSFIAKDYKEQVNIIEKALSQDYSLLIQARNEARKVKNFVTSDLIRDYLKSVGCEIKDRSIK